MRTDVEHDLLLHAQLLDRGTTKDPIEGFVEVLLEHRKALSVAHGVLDHDIPCLLKLLRDESGRCKGDDIDGTMIVRSEIVECRHDDCLMIDDGWDCRGEKIVW
jgi:hypothetical protein